MATFFGLLPAVLIIVLAQLGRRMRVFAVFAYAMLLLVDFILLLTAAGLRMMAAQEIPLTWPWNGQTVSVSPAELHMLSLYVGVSAILALLVLLPVGQRGLAYFISVRPGDSVHATALSFAAYLISLSVVQRVFLDAIARAGVNVSVVSVQDLIGQTAAFILLAFFGVGWVIQRSTRDTLRRLGVVWPHWREFKVAVGTAFGLLIMQAVLGALWMAFSPEGVQAVEDLSKMLLGEFFNPWGAILIGVAAGLGEELVFRGALQPRFGVLLTSVLFAMMHSQYWLSFAMGVVFLLGLVLGIVRKRVNTTAAIFAHAMYNTVLVLLAVYAPNVSP